MRVFISSTCYDLIDLRAEIADFFRQAGVEPILSDDPTSDFHSKTDSNSIEACLANVRSCDAYIIVLSNRYGPKLDGQFYEGKSATHLEYDEAVRSGKPIWMYVRDRLEGEFALWKRNRSLTEYKPVWVQRGDWEIFTLLHTHRTLPEDKQKANWISIFKDSTELKRILKKDFAEHFARAIADKLIDNGRVPFLEVTGKHFDTHNGFLGIEMEFTNLGNTPALSPLFEILTPPDHGSFQLKSIDSHEKLRKGIRVTYLAGSGFSLQTRLMYSILEGHTFEDLGVLSISLTEQRIHVIYVAKKRYYIGAAPQVLFDTKPSCG